MYILVLSDSIVLFLGVQKLVLLLSCSPHQQLNDPCTKLTHAKIEMIVARSCILYYVWRLWTMVP